MNNNPNNKILTQKTQSIMLNLPFEKGILKGIKKADCTYSCALKIIKTLAEKGFIITKTKGRYKMILLTESGKELQLNIIKIKNMWRGKE